MEGPWLVPLALKRIKSFSIFITLNKELRRSQNWIGRARLGKDYFNEKWWRRWDSNPRNTYHVYTLSKRAPSATRTLLHRES